MYLNQLTLHTGGNARLGVLSRERFASKLPQVGERLEVVAFSLGELLQERVVFIAPTMEGGRVYRIGMARPVYIREIGPTPRLARWYEAMGKGAGPNPYIYMVSIDWRGVDTTYQGETSFAFFPPPARDIHGEPRFPDGSDEAIREHIENEWSNATVSQMFDDVQDGFQYAGNLGATVLSETVKATSPLWWGLGVGLAAFIIWKLS